MASDGQRHVHTSGGSRLRLGPLIKSGGAGSVYRLTELPLQVAKLYHEGIDRKIYERKLAAMLELTPKLPDLMEDGRRYVQIAWPQERLCDASGRFIGFLMPAVDVQATSELEVILQERQARAAGLPTGLGAKVTLAANLAAVVAELHRQHHHVVDLKPVNLRFYAQSLYMAMLDCDGFSIQGRGERFPAPQYTPDYLAPEFQALGLTPQGEETQDRFALAVVVFQLLNLGIHPYTGRPASDRIPTDIPGRIGKRCYAYGLRAHADMAPSPVSGHASLPADLRQLFDRAFEGLGGNRPGAMEWAAALRTYAQRSSLRLVTCGKDAAHQHFAGQPCAACARTALITDTRQRAAATKHKGKAAPPPPLGRQRTRPGLPGVGTRTRLTVLQSAQRRYANRPPPVPQRPAPIPSYRQAQSWTLGSLFMRLVLKLLVRLGWLAAFLVAFILIRACDGLLATTRLDAAAPYAARPATPTTPTVPRVSGPEIEELDYTRRDMEELAKATANGSPSLRTEALRDLNRMFYGRRDRGLQGHEPDRSDWLQGLSLPPRPSESRIEEVQLRLKQEPRNPELAFELGWLFMLVGNRQRAEDGFVHAIWADPGHAGAWYGFGVIATDAPVRLGSLMQAEILFDTPESGRNVRMLFTPGLVRPLDQQADQLPKLASHARKLAAEQYGKPPPDE